MLKIDLHTHSIASGHALNTVYEMAAVAKKKGIQVLGITDHAPSMEGAPHQGYFWISDKLERLNGVEILLGAEVNIINKNGEVDLEMNYLQKQPVVIAGIHDKTPYSSEDHTGAIVGAMKNKFIKIISHPYRSEFRVDITKIVNAARSTNTLLEINNQLFEKESENEKFLESYYKLVNLCKKIGLPIIIGSDAHLAKQIGEDKHIIRVKSLIGLANNMIINNRKEDLKRFLKSDKSKYRF